MVNQLEMESLHTIVIAYELLDEGWKGRVLLITWTA